MDSSTKKIIYYKEITYEKYRENVIYKLLRVLEEIGYEIEIKEPEHKSYNDSKIVISKKI